MIKYLLLILLFVSCSADKSDLIEIDLLEYGIPIKVKAPSKAIVDVDDLGIIKDITISDSLKYNVQLFASTASTLNTKKIKGDQLEIVKSAPFFSKVIRDDENGFVYEKKIDEENLRYDFRYIKIQGDKQYIFQTALSGGYTEAEVIIMYEAVK